MTPLRIVINGIGVAGPALGYWLSKSGHEVVLVEAAPRLRTGGYIIDFWGVGYDIAERMGLIGEIRALGYQVREVRFVDREGRKSGGFDVGVFGRMTDGRFTSVRRSELSATIHRAIDGKVETIFGDSVAKIEDDGNRVRVHFDRPAEREVDLVIGADGLHSRVRQLVFGPDSNFETSLGYHVAAFEAHGYRPRYVLAGELHACRGDFAAAFARYEQRLMPFLRKKQRSAERFASSFAPKTSFGIAFRDVITRLLRVPLVADLAIGRDLRDDIALPHYDFSP
jgi:2-polyprenyl-6-methoxyphenol hydroxylase-like FAD-dependent oxidoreductase